MKDRSAGRIDITVAWIIAVAVWLVWKAQPPDLSEVLERGDYSM